LLFSGTTISLQAAGLSLLTAKVQVLDADGKVVATASTTDPTKNDLTLQLSNLKGNSTYYVRVSGARNDVFGVGSYRLSIANGLVNTVDNTVGLLSSELGLNDTLSKATALVQQTVTSTAQYDYVVRASLAASADLDFYHIRTPSAPGGAALNMVALAWGLGASQIDSRIEVYDTGGNRIATEVLTNNEGAFVLQLRNVNPNTDYFLRVGSDSNRIGNYEVAVDFNTTPIDFSMSGTGTLSNTCAQQTAKLNVQMSQQMHFVLKANQSDADATVIMTIRDSANRVVCQLSTQAGDTQSADVFLADGTYTVTVSIVSSKPGPLPTLSYQLAAFGITDPVGAQQSDTTSAPEGGSSTSCEPPSQGSSSSWSSTSSSDGSNWF